MLKTYFIFTLGCQMNHSDSERIEFLLSSFGVKSSPEARADLIIVNSCSVRQKPIDRIWGKLKVWNKINPGAKKILTGCVLEDDLKKLRDEFDYYFKIDDLRDFNQWLEKHFSPKNIAKKIQKTNYLEIEPKRLDKKTAYVPIMNGCNNFCSYCAVPYTRGREWSRRPSTIIKEVRCLADKGYKKILLLGQNVCSYRNPKSQIPNPKQSLNSKFQILNTTHSDDFVHLLKELIKIPDDFEISFMSPHPKDFSDELIDLIAKEKKISKEIHLPMQSGDNKILQKMNRRYKADDYLLLIQKMRKEIKGLCISTDVIVGFPGETEQNFRNTVKLVKLSNISRGYISIYSPRNGTMAQKKYADSVPYEIKKKRWLILEKMINKSKIKSSNVK